MRYLSRTDISGVIATHNPSGDTFNWVTDLVPLEHEIRRGFYADLSVISLSAFPLDVNVTVTRTTFFLYLNGTPIANLDLDPFATSPFTFAYSGVLNLPQSLRLFSQDRLTWGVRVLTSAAPSHVNITGGEIVLLGETEAI